MWSHWTAVLPFCVTYTHGFGSLENFQTSTEHSISFCYTCFLSVANLGETNFFYCGLLPHTWEHAFRRKGLHLHSQIPPSQAVLTVNQHFSYCLEAHLCNLPFMTPYMGLTWDGLLVPPFSQGPATGQVCLAYSSYIAFWTLFLRSTEGWDAPCSGVWFWAPPGKCHAAPLAVTPATILFSL